MILGASENNDMQVALGERILEAVEILRNSVGLLRAGGRIDKIADENLRELVDEVENFVFNKFEA